MEIEIVQGSTEPIEAFLEENGLPPTSPLSSVPELILRDVTGAEAPTSGDVAILDATAWKVSYTPDPEDFKAILGPYTARFKVTNGSVTFFSPSGEADLFRVLPP